MLQEHEALEAAARNWQLCEVYDLGKERCVLTVLPVDFAKASADDVMRAVVTSARMRDNLSLHMLTLMAQYSRR